jgi:hypothetical protein
MRIEVPVRARPPEHAAPAEAAPSASSATAEGTLALRIGRLEIESARPLSSRAIEHGFADAWREHARSADWSAVSAEQFARELQLHAVHGLGGHELGRRIALAVIERARRHGGRGR